MGVREVKQVDTDMQAGVNGSTQHSAHRQHLPLPSSADGKGWEDRMKVGKKKQFDERRYKSAGTREGKEEHETNTETLV